MKTFLAQVAFDGKRLVLRNFSFIFLSLLMPAGFYLLYTKAMISGSAVAIKQFNISYMDQMIVFSILLEALFSIASILKRDRDKGFTTFLRLSPKGVVPYYVSITFWMLMMSLLSVIVLGGIAIGVNNVSLDAGQWLGFLGIILVGQLPILMIGIALSHIRREEMLSLASNLLTFPMAIISGLWWPISLLPKWLQTIGKETPTYFVNNLLNQVTSRATVDLTNLVGIAVWFVLGSLLVVVMTKHEQRKGVALGEA
ncbi:MULTISPECIES: ABC transporter permease [Lacticaseibacillus]|uniref:ABC transporter permease n=1 Tax=Lacticaseibacillus TaxID=2759736 RepID=UPI00063DA162|nr:MULTISPECIES: ABC transporter permease [Lacticaseibacillus]KLI76305.1 multidrug ABC transporter permease [Lacticaseibacillus casei]